MKPVLYNSMLCLLTEQGHSLKGLVFTTTNHAQLQNNPVSQSLLPCVLLKLPFTNQKSIQAVHTIYNCIQTPPASAACCYSASGKEELKISHLKLMLARLLGRPISAAKSSEMKQEGYFKPVQCIRMRTIPKVKHPTAEGVTSGERRSPPDPNIQQQGFCTKGTMMLSC